MDRWLDIFTGVLDIAIGADIRAGTLNRAISNDLADEMAKNLLQIGSRKHGTISNCTHS
jgi:hypothetical protein